MPATTPLIQRPWFRVALGLFAVAWGGNQFTPLLVMYRELDGMSATTVYLLLGVYVLGIAPGLLIGGPASDKYGRRALMLPAPFLAAGGSLLLALGPHSVPLLMAGRLLTGVALGLAMAVGTSWIKELSSPPFDNASALAGARRSSLSLTSGFALGAGAAAALAQWGPWPTGTPYLLNIALCVIAGLWQFGAPETAGPGTGRPVPRRLIDALKVPAVFERRFLLVIIPVAAWVFGTNAVSYAVLPNLLMGEVPGFTIAFSGLMCLVGLSCGFITQQFAGRFQKEGTSRGLVIAMALAALGMLGAAATAATVSVPVGLAASALLGVSYGFLILGGLREVQAIARPEDLAGLTGVFYSIAYAGFFVPMALSILSAWIPYPVLMIIGSGVALIALALVAAGGKLDPQARLK